MRYASAPSVPSNSKARSTGKRQLRPAPARSAPPANAKVGQSIRRAAARLALASTVSVAMEEIAADKQEGCSRSLSALGCSDPWEQAWSQLFQATLAPPRPA